MKRIFSLIKKNILQNVFSTRERIIISENKLPIITISREMGSGGRPLANLLVKKLGKPWKLYHREIIEEMAKESNLEKKLVEEIDEKRMPMIDELIGEFFGKKYLNLSSYYKHLVKILSTVGHRGYVIIMGRGAHYLFPQALNVRIICEMEQRIKWMMRFENLTRRQALQRIEDSDRKRIDFEKSLYGHDPRKAHHYDLVIRTGSEISVEEAADLIVFATKKKYNF